MAMNDATVTASTIVDEQAEVDRKSASRVEVKPTKAGKTKASSTGTAVPARRNAKRSMVATGGKTATPGVGVARQTKTDVVLKKLRMARGATIESLMEATGWQAHSVRGFLSAVVRKKLGLTLVSEVNKDGVRRYRINDGAGIAG